MKYTKLFFGASVLVSWSLLTALFISAFSGDGTKENISPAGNLIAPEAPGGESDVAQSSALTASEVAKHNSVADCWLIINNKVYGVTSYLQLHPGGPATITPYCGKDATAAFASLPRSQNAQSLLARYYLGDVGQKVGLLQSPAQNAPNNASAAPAGTIDFKNASPPASPVPQQAISLASQVSSHNSAASCWIIVSGKIYDVTNYIPYHPGGAAAITPYCGGDASTAFTGLPHSANAANILAQYYLGAAADSAPVPVPNTTNQVATIISPANTTYSTSTLALKYVTADAGSGVDTTACAYRIDAGALIPLPGCADVALPPLANGAHTLVLYSKDNAGNIGVASVSFTVNSAQSGYSEYDDDD